MTSINDDYHTEEVERLDAEPQISAAGAEEQERHARLLVPSLGAPLIPTLAHADHVSLSTGEWLLTITLLTGALVTPVMGRLADGPRQRAGILFALTCVVAGCVVAGVSDDFAELVVGRGLQGVGLGILPVAMAIARRHLPA